MLRGRGSHLFAIPAKAGIQLGAPIASNGWIPASAGMTFLNIWR